jgi:hypothetical protein
MIPRGWRHRSVFVTSARRCAPFAQVGFHPIRGLRMSFALFVRTSAKPVRQSAGNTSITRQCGDVPRPAPVAPQPAVRSLKLGRFGRPHRTQIKERFDQRNPAPNRPLERDALKATDSIQNHWPEYLMEAGELAVYMFATCLVATLLQHPASPVRHAIHADLTSRAHGLGYRCDRTGRTFLSTAFRVGEKLRWSPRYP